MMTRNKSKRSALIKYVLALPIFLLLTAALASPKTPILAKAEVLGDKVVASIDGFEKAQLAALKPLAINPSIGKGIVPTINSPFEHLKEGESGVYINNFKSGGTVTVSELEKMDKMNVVLKYQDKLWEGKVKSYVLVVRTKNQTPVQVNVLGSMNENALKMLKMAKEGDQFQFFNIKGRWAGDAVARDLGSLTFTVVSQETGVQMSIDSTPISKLKEGENYIYLGNYKRGGTISAAEMQKIVGIKVV